MEMEGLQSDDLRVEPSSSPVVVSEETSGLPITSILRVEPSSSPVVVSEETSGLPITSIEELTNAQQQEKPSRKRKLHPDQDFGSDPHEPALKVLRVEERYADVQSNDNSLSALLADASASIAVQDNEQSFITSHRAALEELLEADVDRSGPYGQDPLEPIRSADVAVKSADDEFSANISNPHGLVMEGGLQSQETPSGDVDNALSSSHPPLLVLETMDVVEDDSKFGEIDPQEELQALHVVEDETKFGVTDPESELQALHVVEMTAEDPAKVSTGDSQSELEAPIVVETNREDEANVRVGDPQTELKALPAEKNFEEDYAMRLNDPYTDYGAMNVLEGGPEDGATTMSVGDPQPELEALPVEESSMGDESMRVNYHQSEIECLTVAERAEEDTANLTVSDLEPIIVEEYRKDAMRMPLNDQRSELQTLYEEAENAAKADEAHVSISGPLSRLLQAQLLQAEHVVGNSVASHTQVPICDPQIDLEILRRVVEDHSKMPVSGPPSELQVEGNLVEDQLAAKKRKMVLLASVAAFFSTLAGALGSIGELVGQLEKAVMGAAGIPEGYAAGQFQRTEMEEMASTSSLSESPALRLHSAMSRSSSSLRNNIVVLMFLLMQQHRKRSQKRPRELTGPWYIKPRSAQAFESFLDFSPQGDPDKFRELFRISPTLFFHICEMVSAEMLSDTPRSLRILPNRVLTVERQVAIAIRRLATGNQFLGIADSFGVSKSTAVKVTWKFIVAFIKKARPLHLNWPTGEQLLQIKDGFKSQWGFPNCCGAVDGTHFTVEFPKGEDVSQYYDHQNHVSISMQAIVGHDLRFLDVVVGWPGSIQEYQLLRSTNFFRSVVETKDRLNGDPCVTQDGSSLREYVLGDAGYPLYDWLMVPYPDGLSAAKDEWNSRHAVARHCVENALVRLKGTWRILSRILWKPRKERIGKMVFACCLLHNMIIERNDGLNSEVYADVNPHPGGYTGVSVPTTEVFEGGPEAREVLFREVMGGGIV